ncbi:MULTISPECIES: TonB-dependent receptor [Chitinophagaceae]
MPVSVLLTRAQLTVQGVVVNEQKDSIAFATVAIPALDLETTTDAKGLFVLKNIPNGKYFFQVSNQGYAPRDWEIQVNRNLHVVFLLKKDNLKLNEVTVTAQSATGMTTGYKIGRKALDQLQVVSVADAMALLPGGKTNTSQNLASSDGQTLAVNGRSSEMGSALFGVGVMLDGVTLSNDGIPGSSTSIGKGYDIRNIAATSIESVEVVTGIPSVEYGNITNGLVKINTRKGETPFIIHALAQPNTKQVALSKGFSLSPKSGVFNFSLEHTKSISDITSPYTNYQRNGLTLNYNNTFNRSTGMPILLNAGVSGNLGGYDSKTDPDKYTNTYDKIKDNAIRGNLSVKWVLNKPWITTLEAKGTFNYNNRTEETSAFKNASSSTAAIHATEQGYHIGELYANNPNADIVMIPSGNWYEIQYNDSRLINYNTSLKAMPAKKIGTVRNQFVLGGEYSNSGNNGKGTYYQDYQYAPTWRAYPYQNIPHNRNVAFYAENNINIPFTVSRLELVGGIRSDITSIKGGQYGTIANWSPRANAIYTFWENEKQTIRSLSLKLSWGKMVKLPSFSSLFPTPSYADYQAFASPTTATGQSFYAYYTSPIQAMYNPDLKWQSNVQKEIGLNADIAGNRISISATEDKTSNPYVYGSVYTPFSYKLTDQSSLNNVTIPEANRIYTIDQTTGIVTVSDNTGTIAPVQLNYSEYLRFNTNKKTYNGSPVIRRQLRWSVNFKEIDAIKTSFLVDGNYYYYKGIDYNTWTYTPTATFMSNGDPYRYMGYYIGDHSYANGSLTKNLNINVTATTHIPSIGLVISTRFEGTFYNLTRNLSESGTSTSRSFVLDNKDGYTPSTTQTDIYGGNRFVGLYPTYYVDMKDMSTLIPFEEKFLWAQQNDPTLYNDLTKLVYTSYYDYYFNANRTSFFYSANIAVTKEIGNKVSVTFRATNFINNLAKVRMSQTGNYYSMFNSSSIPNFYYGLSLRLML